jgi:hypothetical protein
MNIPLNQFENWIEPSVLKKGLSYFKNNRVIDCEEISKGQFEATVEGSDNYLVKMEIDNGLIVEKICTCPYDVGPVCKHIAAVLFYMQQDELNIQAKAKKTSLDLLKPKSSAKTVFEKFEETLNKISPEDLKKYLMDYAQEDTGFRKDFMTHFKPPKINDSKEYYVKQIQAILKKGKRQYGFIDRSNSFFVASETQKFIDLAHQFVNTKNYEVAFNISTAILESLIEVFGNSDDSYGEMWGSLDNTFQVLWEVGTSDISEDFRDMLFNYCASKYPSKLFSEWSYDLVFMKIAIHLLKSEQEGESLLKLTHEVKKSNYNFEKIQKLQFDIIYKSQGEANAILFLEKNLQNDILLDVGLQIAIQKEEYEKAIKYAHKGIEDSKGQWNRNGLKWYKHLLNIAEIQTDTENIIKYATDLLLNSNDNTENYLSILKSNIALQNWDSYINQIISKIPKIETETNENLLFTIFKSEERWADMLTVAQKTNSLRSLEKYEKILSPLYPEEMSVKYAEWIQQYLKNNVGREHYQLICRCIRRVKKWGSKEVVNTLVEKLRLQYKVRYALIEELDNL